MRYLYGLAELLIGALTMYEATFYQETWAQVGCVASGVLYAALGLYALLGYHGQTQEEVPQQEEERGGSANLTDQQWGLTLMSVAMFALGLVTLYEGRISQNQLEQVGNTIFGSLFTLIGGAIGLGWGRRTEEGELATDRYAVED